MKVIHIAAEFAPIAKVGGLGEVVQGLTCALEKQGVHTEVIIPKYASIKNSDLQNIKIEMRNLRFVERSRYQDNKVYCANLHTTKLHLIDPKKDYFRRKNIYGYKDDVARFLYFCKASLEYLVKKNEVIDVLHIHDWHTSLIAALYKEIYFKKLKVKAIVLTIHNLQYQGQCKTYDLDHLGFDGKSFLKKDKLQDPYKPRTLNLLKGALIYSDTITVVSPTYAKEILCKEHGFGLDHILKANKKKLTGILNGIDTYIWNPIKDTHIKTRFSANDSMKKFLEAKKKNKALLRSYLKMNTKDVPIIGSIGRLVEQKGPALIKHSIYSSIKQNAQFVLLGAAFSKQMSKSFHKLQKDFLSNQDVSINFSHDEILSHLIFAGCDFLIVPSLFEPCGLTQLVAFQYGVIPIVRKTGGLSDTVFDLDDKTIPINKRNGFTFQEFSINGLDSAMQRAIDYWFKKQKEYQKTIKKNQKLDFSWDKSVKEYIKTYKNLLK